MKNLTKLFSLVIVSITTFGFLGTLKAAQVNCNAVTSEADLQAAYASSTCTSVTITGNFTINDTVTLNGNKQLFIAPSVVVTVGVNGNLTISGYTTAGTVNVNFGANSGLIIDGKVSLIGTTGTVGIGSTGANDGSHITINQTGLLTIKGHKQAGIAMFDQITINGVANSLSRGKLELAENGNGTHTAKITLNSGLIEAYDNTASGVSGVITATGNSRIEAYNNGLNGVNLYENSVIGGNTGLNAYDNGTDESFGKRRTDLAINTNSGSVTIEDNAYVYAEKIGAYWKDNSIQKNGNVTVNGEKATLTYDEVAGGEDDNFDFTVTEGLVQNGNEYTVNGTFTGFIWVPEGFTLNIEAGADVSEATIEVEGGSTIVNKSSADVTVEVADTYDPFVVKAGKTEVIKTVKLTVVWKDSDGESYEDKWNLLVGSKIENLDNLYMYTNDNFTGKTFLYFVDESGNKVDITASLNNDLKIYPVYKEDQVLPNTGDNIVTYVVMSLVSIISLIALAFTTKKSL